MGSDHGHGEKWTGLVHTSKTLMVEVRRGKGQGEAPIFGFWWHGMDSDVVH